MRRASYVQFVIWTLQCAYDDDDDEDDDCIASVCCDYNVQSLRASLRCDTASWDNKTISASPTASPTVPVQLPTVSRFVSSIGVTNLSSLNKSNKIKLCLTTLNFSQRHQKLVDEVMRFLVTENSNFPIPL